jgi:hypothetical protein
MQTIWSLETGVPKQKMVAMKQREMDSQVEQWGQVECEFNGLSPTLHEKTFCKHLIGSENVSMGYRNDVDEAMEKRKASLLMSDRHLKVGPENCQGSGTLVYKLRMLLWM